MFASEASLSLPDNAGSDEPALVAASRYCHVQDRLLLRADVKAAARPSVMPSRGSARKTNCRDRWCSATGAALITGIIINCPIVCLSPTHLDGLKERKRLTLQAQSHHRANLLQQLRWCRAICNRGARLRMWVVVHTSASRCAADSIQNPIRPPPIVVARTCIIYFICVQKNERGDSCVALIR